MRNEDVEATPGMSARLSASYVSRLIRAGGVAVIPSGTQAAVEGVRVTRSVLGEVQVSASFGVEARGVRRAAMIRELLEESGLTVRASDSDPSNLYVSRREPMLTTLNGRVIELPEPRHRGRA